MPLKNSLERAAWLMNIRLGTPPSNEKDTVKNWPVLNLNMGAEIVDVRKSVLAPVGQWHIRGLLGTSFVVGRSVKKPGFYSWTLTSSWQLRLPTAAEVFYDPKFAPIDSSTGLKNLKKIPPMLGTQPRHLIDTKLTYNVTTWGAITFEHTYGSLPPAFLKTDHSFAIGLAVMLKQSNYGRTSILKP